MKQKNKKLKPNSKNGKIRMIEIRGISGLLKLIYIITCAIAGFVVFPGVALMYLWNTFLSSNSTVPAIGLFQGLLLYGILVVLFLICKGTRFSLACSFSDLSDEELDSFIAKAKLDAERRMRMSSVELCKAKLDELESAQKENTELNENKKEEI